MAIIHLVSIIVPIILAIVNNTNIRHIVYWILNVIFPSINAQVIITYMLANKSHFCQDYAAILADIFPEIGNETIGVNWVILVLQIIILLLLIIMVDTGFLRFST